MPWVKQQLCTGCGTCIQQCPTEAIYWFNAKAKIYMGNCNGCGKCLEICEQQAIRPDTEEMTEEDKPKPKYNWPF